MKRFSKDEKLALNVEIERLLQEATIEEVMELVKWVQDGGMAQEADLKYNLSSTDKEQVELFNLVSTGILKEGNKRNVIKADKKRKAINIVRDIITKFR